MAYDRYDRPDNVSRDSDYRRREAGQGFDYRSDRDFGSSASRGSSWRDDDRGGRGEDRERFGGGRDYYGGSQQSYGRTDYGADRGQGRGYADRGAQGYGSDGARQGRYGRDDTRQGQYRGSYASDGHRFAEQGDGGRRDDRRFEQGYDDDRGFLARAGDEVRSWFGDEEAERRRERDQRYDEQMARYDERTGDHAYRSWRDTQVSAFDRDYDEYRQENASKFQNEFAAFRTERQGQRDSLTRVGEHMEVLGSDGEHVGIVDKVRGDRIILTKTDVDAGGHHHSIPSRWVDTVDDKVKLRKTAAEAQQAWRDEDRNQAVFGEQSGNRSYGQDRFGNDAGRDDRLDGAQSTVGNALGAGTSTTAGTGIGGRTDGDRGTDLNRSFSGTY